MRELTFSENTILPLSSFDSHLSDSKENLMNTSLFNYVYISYVEDDNYADSLRQSSDIKYVIVRIVLEERWYWWPLFELHLEDKNTSSWFKHMKTDRITYEAGGKIYNIFGLGHKFEIVGRFGFEKGVNLKYSRLVLNKKKTAYLNIEAFHTINKIVDYISYENKLQSYKSNKVLKKNWGGSVHFVSRHHHRTTNSVKLSFDYENVADSLLVLNPNFWGVNATRMRYLQVEYSYKRDYRNYAKYPTKGFLLEFKGKIGEGNLFDFLYLNVSYEYQRYTKLSDKWYLNNGVNISNTFHNHTSFIHDQAIGYEESNISGYDLYVIDGQHFIIQNNTLKYSILEQKIVPLNFIKKWNRFNKPFFSIYANAMLDFGYVYQSDKNMAHINKNNYTNKFLVGGGVRIDLLTYYDIIISVGYTINSFGKSSFVFGLKSELF